MSEYAVLAKDDVIVFILEFEQKPLSRNINFVFGTQPPIWIKIKSRVIVFFNAHYNTNLLTCVVLFFWLCLAVLFHKTNKFF